ncbi:MAG: hypothetical protein QXW70_02680 [Candidatus Anstonellales archaeon]
MNKTKTTERGATPHDPTVTLFIGIVGFLLFGLFPALGHIYIRRIKRGIVLNIIYLLALVIGAIIYSLVSVASPLLGIGALCCIPFVVFLLLVGFAVAIIADAYKIAKGEGEFIKINL